MKHIVIAVALVLAGSAYGAEPTFKLVNKVKIGGPNGWDYVYVDTTARRLYVSHTTQVEVVDLTKMALSGTIPNTLGVHGIAIASDLGRGFTSNGRDNSVTIFDVKTLAFIGKTQVGMNPDAILYEPSTKRVFTFNGNSKDATVLDAKTGMVLSTIPLGGKPEFSQTNGKGTVWVNIEDTAEVVELDAAKASVTKRYSLAPCEEPTGLAFDASKVRLFSACSNNMAAVSDPKSGKVLTTLPIGQGADGIAYDAGMAFTSNGGGGTMTVIEEKNGKYSVLETVPTQRTARTIGVDPTSHRLYLPAAESGPPTVSKDGKQVRPTLLPDSFSVLVFSR